MSVGPEITGRLVRLRAPRGDDARRMTELLQDRRVARHLDHWSDPPYAIDKALDWVSHVSRAADTVAWCIETLDDGTYIGNTGLDAINRLDGHCSWGIWIGPPGRWGHGYGTEACMLAVEHAFRDQAMEKVTLQVYAGNDRGRRAYRRAGFTAEGTLRRHHRSDSGLVDVDVMAAFRDNPLYAQRIAQ